MGARQKRAIYVTGAGNGIGRNIAQAFAAKGDRVGILDIDREAAADAAEKLAELGVTTHAEQVNVADEASVAAAFEAMACALGPADVLVNCAGVWIGGSVTEISVAGWDLTMAVNIRGPFLCCRAVLPAMAARRHGVIVNISSIAGLKGTRQAGAYNSSKAALIALTKNLALDYSAVGVRASVICPGLIAGTDMDQKLRAFRGDTPEYQATVLALHPIGRLGSPSDVANAAVFLASDAASWITGAAIVVDGGAMTGY